MIIDENDRCNINDIDQVIRVIKKGRDITKHVIKCLKKNKINKNITLMNIKNSSNKIDLIKEILDFMANTDNTYCNSYNNVNNICKILMDTTLLPHYDRDILSKLFSLRYKHNGIRNSFVFVDLVDIIYEYQKKENAICIEDWKKYFNLINKKDIRDAEKLREIYNTINPDDKIVLENGPDYI